MGCLQWIVALRGLGKLVDYRVSIHMMDVHLDRTTPPLPRAGVLSRPIGKSGRSRPAEANAGDVGQKVDEVKETESLVMRLGTMTFTSTLGTSFVQAITIVGRET